MRRCRKVLGLCLAEDAIASAAAIGRILISGKFLQSIFNHVPEVIQIGYVRLVTIFSAYVFSMLYEVMSGYLRGFGISLEPAILTTIGVCGIRFAWIYIVFQKSQTFQTIMLVYPISLAATAVLIGVALLVYRPSRRLEKKAVYGKHGIKPA